jgi:hypothetical protein
MDVDAFIGHLEAFDQQLDNDPFQQPLEKCLELFHEGVRKNFEQTIDSRGSLWPPRKDNLPHPLLILTTAMHQAATERSASGSLAKIADREFEAGVDGSVIEYAAYQQFGTRVIPPREYLYASEATLLKFDQVVREHVRQFLTG